MNVRSWGIVLISILGAGALWAHHSVTAVFDVSKQLTLAGELSDVDWVNPHIFLYMKTKNASGVEETWKIEGGPPSWYRRVGVNRATFAKRIGEKVSIEANPSKTGEPYSYLRRVTFGNGDKIESASPSEVSQSK